MLEEKTVKELRQMARDKDLSGYSNLRKAELIELIDENYSEEEVELWPEGEEKESESEAEIEEVEKTEEPPSEDKNVPVESVKVPEEETRTKPQELKMGEEMPAEKIALIGIIAIVLIVLIIALII